MIRFSLFDALVLGLLACIVFGTSGCATGAPTKLTMNGVELGKDRVVTIKSKRIVYLAKF
jgi:hypothetical protein